MHQGCSAPCTGLPVQPVGMVCEGWDGEQDSCPGLMSVCPTLPCLLCPGGSSAPWGWMGVVLGAGLALAVLSSPKGLKVVKRGRSSSMGSPVPGNGEKKAQGREASFGAPRCL